MPDQPLLTPKIMGLLRSHYNLDCSTYQPLPGFYTNNLSFFGDYFVKISCKEPREVAYTARLEAVEWLIEQGFPVPILVKTMSGQRFLRSGKMYVEVHKRLFGVEGYTARPEQLRDIGSMIAGIHQALDLWNDNAKYTLRGEKGSFGPILEGPAVVDELEQYYGQLQLVPYEPLRNYLAGEIPILKEHLPALQEKKKDLNQGIVHGDLHDLQMLFDNSSKKLVAFIDWENMHYRTRAFEVGFMADRLSTDTRRLYYDEAVPLQELKHDQRKLDIFLEAYNAVKPLSGRDLNALVDEALVEAAGRATEFLRKLFTNLRHGKEIDFSAIHRHLRIQAMRRIEELRERLPID